MLSVVDDLVLREDSQRGQDGREKCFPDHTSECSSG